MIFGINRSADYKRRKRAFAVSALLPGMGQLITGRAYGIFYILTIALTLAFLFHLNRMSVFSNGLIISGYVLFYLINLVDAFWGPLRRKSPCQLACPAGINVSDYIALVADRRFEEAKALIKLRMPFVSVCGTICNHPCERKCVRSGYDEPVMIMNIKKTVSDYKEIKKEFFTGKTDRTVGIVGGGPAGLSLAYFLSMKGIHSTVYEKENDIGGLLRFGIPRFRIDMLDLLKDVESIAESEFIDIRTKTAIGRDMALEDLRKDHDITVMAIGNNAYHCPHREMVPDRNVYPALDILKEVAKNEVVNLGKRVCIVGGGNVAIDAARTAVRLGSSPEIFYRRGREQMKASEEELSDAEEEGIITRYHTEIKEINDSNGLIRIKFHNEMNEEYEEGFSSILYATGQYCDLSVVHDGLMQAGWKSNMKGVYIVNDRGTIVETVAEARRVSQRIISGIYGMRGVMANIYDNMDYSPQIRNIPDAHWNYDRPRHTERIDTVCLDNEKRNNTFFKVKRDLSKDEAVQQAKRCLRCNKQ